MEKKEYFKIEVTLNFNLWNFEKNQVPQLSEVKDLYFESKWILPIQILKRLGALEGI